MNQIRISLSFADKTELFNFMQNVSNAIQVIAEKAETIEASSADMFSIMELAKLQKQVLIQYTEKESITAMELTDLNIS